MYLYFGCGGSFLLHGDYSLLQYLGCCLQWFLLLWSTASRFVGSVVAAPGLQLRLSSCVHRLSRSAAHGSSPARYRIDVPYITRWILKH